MNTKQYNSHDMMIRTKTFLTVHAAVLTAPAQALVPTLNTKIAAIETLRMGQVAGNGQCTGGVTERREIAKELRQMMLDIAKTARVLAKAGHLGLDDELRVPHTRQYSALLGAADAFVTKLTVAETKALFTARGFEATFVEDLDAKADAFRTATERKAGGVNEQIGSTAGMTAAIRAGVAIVRDLDAILDPQLRKTDPALHGSWKAAVHIERPPKKKPAEAETPQQPAGTMTAMASLDGASLAVDRGSSSLNGSTTAAALV